MRCMVRICCPCVVWAIPVWRTVRPIWALFVVYHRPRYERHDTCRHYAQDGEQHARYDFAAAYGTERLLLEYLRVVGMTVLVMVMKACSFHVLLSFLVLSYQSFDWLYMRLAGSGPLDKSSSLGNARGKISDFRP